MMQMANKVLVVAIFMVLLVFTIIGVLINISLTSNYTIVGQVSDTRYDPQVFGTVTDSTKVTFYGGNSYTFIGDLRSQLEPNKVYTIKYHHSINIAGGYNVADSILEGLHIG